MSTTQGLTVYEANALRAARELLMRKPEAVIRYLTGGGEEGNRGLVALILSAHLEKSRQYHDHQKFMVEVLQFLTKNKEPSND